MYLPYYVGNSIQLSKKCIKQNQTEHEIHVIFKKKVKESMNRVRMITSSIFVESLTCKLNLSVVTSPSAANVTSLSHWC